MTNQPVTKIRAGSITAAIWENEIRTNGQTRRVLKATVERRYRDAEGTWKSTDSFARNDIPLAIHCLYQAFQSILDMESVAASEREQSRL